MTNQESKDAMRLIEDATNLYKVSEDLEQVMPLVAALCEEVQILQRRLDQTEARLSRLEDEKEP